MKLKYQAALLTAALAMASCSNDDLFGVADGKLGSVYKPGVEVSNAEKVIKDGSGTSRASYDISNYIVEFCRQGETTPVSTYVYRDMPGAVELPEGAYTVSVRSHDVKKAEWENPYFAGVSEAFNVVAGDFTEVKPIKCTFQSLKVSIFFDDALREAMGDDVQVTVIANDEGKLVYTPSETRAGYFEALEGSVSLVATFTGTVNGNYENFSRTFADVAAGQHRKITFKLGANGPEPDKPQGGVGGSGISVDLSYTDENLTGDVDPGQEDVIKDNEETPGTLPDIKDPDDPNNPENPDDPGKDEAITFESENLKNGGSYTSTQFDVYAVKIMTPKGCQDINVTINSTTLTPEELSGVGLSDKFSLVNDTQYFEALNGLTLPCGDGVKDQTEITFDISSFMSLLAILGPSSSEFSLDVTDNEGNNQKMTFTIIVE